MKYIYIYQNSQRKVKVLPAPLADRAASISVSVTLGHTSANVVKATEGGKNGPLSHSILLCRAPHEKAVSTIFKVFLMTRPGLEPTTYWL